MAPRFSLRAFVRRVNSTPDPLKGHKHLSPLLRLNNMKHRRPLLVQPDEKSGGQQYRVENTRLRLAQSYKYIPSRILPVHALDLDIQLPSPPHKTITPLFFARQTIRRMWKESKRPTEAAFFWAFRAADHLQQVDTAKELFQCRMDLGLPPQEYVYVKVGR